jgi:transcriptional regulator with XRE-family HTH domain
MGNFDFSIIRTLRQKWQLTAEELAGRAGLTRATVAKIEAGDGNPTIETIEAISTVFQLTPSELIRLAEVAQCETAVTEPFRKEGLEGSHIWFPNFEIYRLRGEAGTRKASDPTRHENTAEVCLVLSGRIRVTVGRQARELGPGMALRFKALHEHQLEFLEEAEILLMHHVSV